MRTQIKIKIKNWSSELDAKCFKILTFDGHRSPVGPTPAPPLCPWPCAPSAWSPAAGQTGDVGAGQGGGCGWGQKSFHDSSLRGVLGRRNWARTRQSLLSSTPSILGCDREGPWSGGPAYSPSPCTGGLLSRDRENWCTFDIDPVSSLYLWMSNLRK